jgi:hypothetical protein
MVSRRVAQLLISPGRTDDVGAPSFARFAKVGNAKFGSASQPIWYPAASLPALAKCARTGHPLVW